MSDLCFIDIRLYPRDIVWWDLIKLSYTQKKCAGFINFASKFGD